MVAEAKQLLDKGDLKPAAILLYSALQQNDQLGEARYLLGVALKRNGEYMTVRDKGPLFIIYPFDSDPELKAQKYYSRSVWQVALIEVK